MSTRRQAAAAAAGPSHPDGRTGHLDASATIDERAALFTETRPLLFAIAYRMLGSVTDAEDLVQDAYLRWQDAAGNEIREPRAYLTTIVTRLALNHLRSARVQRETYVGPWLPEPLVTDHAPDPSEPVELAESLSMAFMLMLERLSPLERAVLLLHDVFDFQYAEIARMVDKSEANCRQALSRAKKRLGSPQPRFAVDPAEAQRLVEHYIQAASTGDLEGMLAVLADDVALYPDSGGKLPGAARRPIHGSDAVARLIASGRGRLVPVERTIVPATINGQPGLVMYVSGHPFAALIFEIRDHRIQTVYGVGNPDKLQHIPGVTG